MGSLRASLEPDREENYTVLMVLPDDQVAEAMELIDQVADLDRPGNGIAFTVPVELTKGIGRL